MTQQGASKLVWTGPFAIRDLLTRCLDDAHPWPPGAQAVYLVSKLPWTGHPTAVASPLYFGGNTGRGQRFCTRVGDLIADMFGFWDGGSGHHSGGQSLYKWCKKEGVAPGDLFLAWGTCTPWCGRCSEGKLARDLAPDWSQRSHLGLLNRNRPPVCSIHAPK